jgi:hypothetical protein
MSLEQASVVSEILSAVAVIVSLFYLAVQVRGNTKALRSQAYFNATSIAHRPAEIALENPGQARIFEIGCLTPETLNAEDREQFGRWAFLMFNGWEYFFYQFRDESIPSHLWIGANARYASLLGTKPGLARFWSEYQPFFDEPFRSHVAALVPSSGLENAAPSD